MARWNPRRWSLGTSALVALVIAGCGSTSQPRASLHRSAEKRLLSLVSRARVDASARDGTAVGVVLGEFVSEVNTLKKSGQLASTTAAQLERAARSTAARATDRLHRTQALHQTHAATPATAGPGAPQTPPAADPVTTTPTAPASASPPSESANDASADRGRQDTNPAPPVAQRKKQSACTSRWPGHHHPNGKGLGHDGFGNPNCQEGGHYQWGRSWHGGGDE